MHLVFLCTDSNISSMHTARFALESCFARGFRPGKKPIHVVGGNFFYSARPVGVQYGVDFLHTGVIRSIETESFQKCFDNRDIVLLSPVGHCPSGEFFSLQAIPPPS